MEVLKNTRYPGSAVIMRRFGPLIVLAILFILGGVGAAYYARLRELAAHAPGDAKTTPQGTEGTAQDWNYTKTQDGRKIVSIRAKGLEQVEGKMQLDRRGTAHLQQARRQVRPGQERQRPVRRKGERTLLGWRRRDYDGCSGGQARGGPAQRTSDEHHDIGCSFRQQDRQIKYGPARELFVRSRQRQMRRSGVRSVDCASFI